jgi:hypothetical protein
LHCDNVVKGESVGLTKEKGHDAIASNDQGFGS